jgi:hypothetical protein
VTGYSGTPLARKLSLKDGLRTWWHEMPSAIRSEIDSYGYQLHHLIWPEAPIEAAHVFVTERAELEATIHRLRDLLAPDGFVWISWPKKASGVATDITEDVIRDVALPTGLVDVKVCAVNEIWSGLKLMIRKELRPAP